MPRPSTISTVEARNGTGRTAETAHRASPDSSRARRIVGDVIRRRSLLGGGENQPLSHTDRTGHSPEHSATAPDLARAPEGARSARGGPHEREAVLGPAVRARAYRELASA